MSTANTTSSAGTSSFQPIELWWGDTRDVSAALDAFADKVDLLSSDDVEGRSDESRWARIVLRLGLCRFGDRALAQCPVQTSPSGRPLLAGRDFPVFSISHSANHIAVSIAAAGPIGIDVEAHRPIKMSGERQQQILNQASRHGLDLGGVDLRAPEANQFLAVWTKLEAVAKARGDGIGAILTEMKQEPANMSSELFSKVGSADIAIQSLSLSANFAAALATAKDAGAPRIHRLPTELPELLALYST